MSKDNLGDRMKEYEGRFSGRLMPLLPVLARIDGRAFHNYTRKLGKPFDEGFVDLMRMVTQYLAAETKAVIGYTQSDEITLAYYSPSTRSQIFFDGKLQKMCSVLASMTTAVFNQYADEYITNPHPRIAEFDCRVWQVPTLCEAANVFVWRELDATRNSLEMLARAHFSHNQLYKKGANLMHDMLHEKGVNWNDLPAKFKRGSYYGWKMQELAHTCTAACPSPAHPGPKFRKKLVPLDLEPILTYPDRVQVLFNEHSCSHRTGNVTMVELPIPEWP